MTALSLVCLLLSAWIIRERHTSARLRAARSRTARTLWRVRAHDRDTTDAFCEVMIERNELMAEVQRKRRRPDVSRLN